MVGVIDFTDRGNFTWNPPYKDKFLPQNTDLSRHSGLLQCPKYDRDVWDILMFPNTNMVFCSGPLRCSGPL